MFPYFCPNHWHLQKTFFGSEWEQGFISSSLARSWQIWSARDSASFFPSCLHTLAERIKSSHTGCYYQHGVPAEFHTPPLFFYLYIRSGILAGSLYLFWKHCSDVLKCIQTQNTKTSYTAAHQPSDVVVAFVFFFVDFFLFLAGGDLWITHFPSLHV